MCWIDSCVKVNTDFFVNLSCSTIFCFLWLIPFTFWKSKLIVFIFYNKDFILVFIKNYCSTSWFVLGEFWNDKIRINIERFRTVKSKFFKKTVSLIIRNRRIIFKLKNWIDVIIPCFLSMITYSGLLLFLLLRQVNKKLSDNWLVDLKLSFIAWFSLHLF